MPTTELPELTLEFHEPGTAMRRSRVEGEALWLTRQEQAGLSTILDFDVQRDRKLLTDWRIQLKSRVNAVEVEPLYKGSGIAIPPIIRELMKRYSFYYLVFGGSLLVAEGATPKKLRFAVAFQTDPDPDSNEASVFDLFPKTQWRKWAQASLTFGVKAELGFNVPLNPTTYVPFLRVGEISAEAKAGFLVGPLEFSFERAEIIGSGKGSYVADWRITKGAILKSGDFDLYCVLQIPKGLTSVNAHAEMETKVRQPGFWPRREKSISDAKDYQIVLVDG